MTGQWAGVAVAGDDGRGDEVAIERAEDAVRSFADSFADEADRQIARLDAAYAQMSALDASVGASNLFPCFSEVFEAAHEIKGQAGSFGYDLLTHVCESLCCVVENRKILHDSAVAAIGHHIMAIHVIVERDLEGMGGTMGAALLRELGELKTCIAASASHPLSG